MIEVLDPHDTTRCPLCGQANECAIAAGRDAESCWCMNVFIDTAALASIPADARGKVCICVRCASETTATS
jgi:hypothetical protein